MKIDMVYLWVDSLEPIWQEKRKKYALSFVDLNKEANADCRFMNNDELKYSLRSVEKYASWVNKIYIVTDNQVPTWLDINNPKVKIINHSDIIPQENLPLFNSCAIESRIPFIKGLSEYFLYANEDTFFWDYVNPEFFFYKEKPILRFRKKIKRKAKQSKELYHATLIRAYDIVSTKYTLPLTVSLPHHNIDPYCKSLFLECIKEFQDEFNLTLNNKFRDYSDMQRISVYYYMLAKGLAIPKYIELNLLQKHVFKTKADSRYYGIKTKTIDKLKMMNTKLLCINDTFETTNADRIKVKQFLDKKFPEKSSFEK